jgi:capsular polysaccharide biosynthesis protein
MRSSSTSEKSGALRVVGPAAAPADSTPMQDASAAWAALRRRWRSAAGVLALTILAAFIAAHLGGRQYQATAEILLQQPDDVNSVLTPGGIPSAANAQRDVNTNAELITSIPVANAVRAQLRLPESAQALIGQLAVSGEGTSNLVQITARDASAQRAAAIATAVAVQYKDFRRRSAQDAIGAAADAARERLNAMTAADRASAQGVALLSRLHQLVAGAAVATGGVQVVRSATVPTAPVPRLTLSRLVVILVLGLMLAGLAMFVREKTDRRLLDDDMVEEAFGMPIVGRVPRTAATAAGEAERNDAYEALAIRLGFWAPTSGTPVVLVATATAGVDEDVAMELADTLSEFGRRVLVIDADPYADVDGSSAGGLTAVLRGERTLADQIVVVSRQTMDGTEATPTFELLPAGSPGSRRSALLTGPAAEELFRDARRRADVVIVTVPPLTTGRHHLLLAPMCDAVLLVVGERAATREDASRTRELLADSGPMTGIVVVQRLGAAWRTTWKPRLGDALAARRRAPAEPQVDAADAGRLSTARG